MAGTNVEFLEEIFCMSKQSEFRTSFSGAIHQRNAALDAYVKRYEGTPGVAQVHKSFANLKEVPRTDALPPLARILKGSGGRGGENRLKTYLTLIWLAERDAREGQVFWDINETKETLGRIVGVFDEDTGKPGADRKRDVRVRDQMNRSLRWLDTEGLIHRHRFSSKISLLDDRGSGGPYVAPGTNRDPRGELPTPFPREDLWFKIPASFWRTGLIGKMAADELAAYLCLLSDLDTGSYKFDKPPKSKWQFFARDEWDDYIKLSREMQYSGLRKLERRDIVSVRSVPVTPGGRSEHVRHQYLLDPTFDGRVAPPTERDLRILAGEPTRADTP